MRAVRTKAINQQPQPGRRSCAVDECMLRMCEETVTEVTLNFAKLPRRSGMGQSISLRVAGAKNRNIILSSETDGASTPTICRHGCAMPMLTREDAQVLVCIRRLLTLWRAVAPAPSLQQIFQELKRMSETFDRELTQLRDDVAAQSTVIASATAAFRGLAAQLAAAEASAKSAGATDAQISGVSAVRQTLETNTAALAAAIPANTPAATDPTAPAPTTAS